MLGTPAQRNAVSESKIIAMNLRKDLDCANVT